MQRSFLARSFSAFTRGVLAASIILLILSFLEKADAKPIYADSELLARVARLETSMGATRDAHRLRNLYRNNGYQPLWQAGPRAIQRRRALATVLERISSDGLDSHHYRLVPVDDAVESVDYRQDVAISRAFLRLIDDLARGKTSPSELGIEWDISREQTSSIDLARQILSADNFTAAVESVRPAHKHYQTLRTALAYYQRLSTNGGWRPLPTDTLLKPGAMSSHVALLRERLAIESGNNRLKNAAVPELYGKELEAAVTAFQRRHGLEPDGIVGRNTVAALNVPVEQRIEQIALNLERWRWLPRQLGERHILVNTAEFSLALYEHDKPTLDMRVVVGKTQRQTPIVSKSMRYLVLNPTWTVPPKILHDDILPKLAENPDYLRTRGMRVFDGWSDGATQLTEGEVDWSRISERHSPYRVEQAPGEQNALGRIKFMFPNQHSVYIHDTPSRGLFSERVRAFSSGCVRVEHPLALAEALLAGSERWQDNKLQNTLDAGETTSVILKESVPVHLVYLTAWISETGELHFRDDIYKRDARLQLALLNTDRQRKNS